MRERRQQTLPTLQSALAWHVATGDAPQSARHANIVSRQHFSPAWQTFDPHAPGALASGPSIAGRVCAAVAFPGARIDTEPEPAGAKVTMTRFVVPFAPAMSVVVAVEARSAPSTDQRATTAPAAGAARRRTVLSAVNVEEPQSFGPAQSIPAGDVVTVPEPWTTRATVKLAGADALLEHVTTPMSDPTDTSDRTWCRIRIPLFTSRPTSPFRAFENPRVRRAPGSA